MQASRLVEEVISNTKQVAYQFKKDENGLVPLVLLPKSRWFFIPWMRVPSDAFVLMTKFGKHYPDPAEGMQPEHYQQAGLKFLPPWYKMSYLVNRKATAYSAPVSQLPTSDDIMIQLEMTLDFFISNPYKFVYELGVLRFDEYLHAAVEEAIRIMVRKTPHTEVFDMRGHFSKSMVVELNSNFEPLGVTFADITIKKVDLPSHLFKLLGSIRELKSQKQKQLAEHLHILNQMQDKADYDLAVAEKKARVTIAELEAKRNQAKQQLEEQVQRSEEKLAIEIEASKKEAYALREDARTALMKGRLAVEESAQTQVHAAQNSYEVSRITADENWNTKTSQAKSSFILKESKIKSDLLEAEGEFKAQKAFREKRIHELEKAYLSIMKNLAGSGRVVITGDRGQQLLDSLSNFQARKD